MTAFEQFPAAMTATRTRPLFVRSVEVSRQHMPGGSLGRRASHRRYTERRLCRRASFGHRPARSSDWQTFRSDGVVVLDARILLSTYAGIR